MWQKLKFLRSLNSSILCSPILRELLHIRLDDDDDDDDEIASFTVRWKTRASFVYRTNNIDNNDKDSRNRKRSH